LSIESLNESGQSLHVLQGDLIVAKPKHSPASQSGLQVFLQIGIEASRPVVPPIDPDATFHLNQAAGLQMGKIGPPTPFVVEMVFPLQGSPARGLPEHQEAILKARGRFGSTVTQAGHGLLGESTADQSLSLCQTASASSVISDDFNSADFDRRISVKAGPSA